jgi:hypothetical protein
MIQSMIYVLVFQVVQGVAVLEVIVVMVAWLIRMGLTVNKVVPRLMRNRWCRNVIRNVP